MAIQPTATFTPTKQTFLNSVVNKIGKQEYSDQAYVNPLKRLKGGFIENASEIEEIYVSPVEAKDFDAEGKGSLDRVKPNVKVQYHNNEKEHSYQTTIHDKEVRKGFRSSEGVQKLADHLIQSLHNGTELVEYKDMVEVLKALCNAKMETNTFEVEPVIDEPSAMKLCKSIKKVIPKMGEWNALYSKVANFAPKGKLILFLDSDVDVEIKIEYLASVFNMTVAELNDTTKMIIPNLKDKLGDNVIALLCDERCIKINPTYYNCESVRNAKGKFTNYHLATQTLFSYTDWFQFAVFKEKVQV